MVTNDSSLNKKIILNGVNANPDTLATVYIAGPELMHSGGRIAFGKRGDVSIGESSYYGKEPLYKEGTLCLRGNGGFNICVGDSKKII